VITFHAIDEVRSPLSYPARALERLLADLDRAGLPLLPLDRLLAPDANAGVALTFDDGIASLYEAALPILRERQAPAHLYLTTGVIGGDNRWDGQPASAPAFRMLSWSQVEALHAAGVSIEGHTANHPDLRSLSEAAIEAEMEAADALIERRVGRRPTYFAYPYGHFDAKARAVARRRYAAAFTTRLAGLEGGEPADALPRLDSHYLRSPWLTKRLNSPAARSSIALRRRIRVLRGHEPAATDAAETG
jgi:peptidoglycan/xylan/chitin deacetylase (PgdA/CDA1 family)